MKKPLLAQMILLGLLLAGCGLGEKDFEAPEQTVYKIEIDGGYGIYVVGPGSFTRNVRYEGVTAQRAIDLFGLAASLNAAHDQLTLELANQSGRPVHRLWAVAVESVNVELTDPDAVNKKNQPVVVFGPFEPLEQISRSLTVKILDVPASLKIDLLEVDDRVAFSSSKDLNLIRRIWTLDLSGQDLYRVDPSTDSTITQNSPTWSPGMEWIAYDEVHMAAQPFESRIYIRHPDGAPPRPVSPAGFWSELACFTPSGKGLIYKCPARLANGVGGVCSNDIKGSSETLLVAGDGTYWDGSAFQPFANFIFYRNTLQDIRLTPDGKHLLFKTLEEELSPSPVVNSSRMYMFEAPYDPDNNILDGPPRQLGKLYDGDSITTSTKFTRLYDCMFSFTPDSQNIICFLQTYAKVWDPQLLRYKWPISFSGLAKVRLSELLAAPPDAYFGNYFDQIYPIIPFYVANKAAYINWPDYSWKTGQVFFAMQYNTYKQTVIEQLQLDPDFQPVGDPVHFFYDQSYNFSPRVPPPMIRGYYR